MTDFMIGSLIVTCCILCSVLLGYAVARLQTERTIVKLLELLERQGKEASD